MTETTPTNDFDKVWDKAEQFKAAHLDATVEMAVDEEESASVVLFALMNCVEDVLWFAHGDDLTSAIQHFETLTNAYTADLKKALAKKGKLFTCRPAGGSDHG